MTTSKKTKKIYRSSKTGKFVRKGYAKEHPATTEEETIHETTKKQNK